jgi:hypothetical protein
MAEMKRLLDRGTEFGPTAARHAALIYGHRESNELNFVVGRQDVNS